MFDKGGSTSLVEYVKNAAVIIAVCVSVYQGSSILSNTFKEQEMLRNDLSRQETRIDKLEESVNLMKENVIIFHQNTRQVAEMATLLREIERTVIELSILVKNRG